MRTSEECVVAEIESNGRTYERKFYIATKNGELMTRRLRRLLAGSISHYYDQRNRERVYFHFVGMIWRPPYRLLQEIVQDRLSLQTELAGLVVNTADAADLNLNGLLRELPTPIPEKAPHDKITTLMQHELELRRELDSKIKEVQQYHDSRVPRPYEVD